MQDRHRYGQWRDQWLHGVQTQAISLVCHHGLARALVLAAPLPAPAPAQDAVSMAAPGSLLTQASSMSCTLLHTIQTNHVVKF